MLQVTTGTKVVAAVVSFFIEHKHPFSSLPFPLYLTEVCVVSHVVRVRVSSFHSIPVIILLTFLHPGTGKVKHLLQVHSILVFIEIVQTKYSTLTLCVIVL